MAYPPNFEIRCRGATPSIPLVAHVPHSSTTIPEDILKTFCIDRQEVEQELPRITDWYTDELFGHVLPFGGTMFVNKLSRLVIDPERFPDDAQEGMSKVGMGAVYTKMSDGRPLRENVSRDDLLQAYFYPYATAFQDLVSRVVRQL